MSETRFEWDPEKARANVRKHAVTFEEARTAFADEFAIIIGDPDHSDDEDRFVLVGYATARLLVVCHAYRADEKVIRIISARKANKKEHEQYKERWAQ